MGPRIRGPRTLRSRGPRIRAHCRRRRSRTGSLEFESLRPLVGSNSSSLSTGDVGPQEFFWASNPASVRWARMRLTRDPTH
jgi:hypothetical protein